MFVFIKQSVHKNENGFKTASERNMLAHWKVEKIRTIWK